MVHAPWRKGGALPDQLHPGHRPFSATEFGGPGCMAQHGPLSSPGLPPRHRSCRTLAISRDTQEFSHQAADDLGRDQPPFCGDPGGGSQAILEGTPAPGVDISRNLSSYQHQYCSTLEQGPAEFKGAQSENQNDHPRGLESEIRRGRLRSGFPPHF